MAAPLVDRLEKVIRRHILEAVPNAACAELSKLGLIDLVIAYRVWRSRFVAPVPRTVHISPELAASSKVFAHQAAFEAIRAKIEAGEDINAHLSTRIRYATEPRPGKKLKQRRDLDLLLSDWGIHHLHLSTSMKGEFTERTGDVLFAAFTETDAYLIGIYDHPSHDNWAAQEIFATLVRNWPDAGLALELGDLRPTQSFSDEDRKKLRDGAVNQFVEVDGKIYMPGDLGLTTAGTPMSATEGANKLAWALRDWRTDTDERLQRIEGVPAGTIWYPTVHVAVPGFEEYAGFRAGSNFLPVERVV